MAISYIQYVSRWKFIHSVTVNENIGDISDIAIYCRFITENVHLEITFLMEIGECYSTFINDVSFANNN